MYKKYLVITCKENPAGMNIVNNLEQFKKNPLLGSLADKPHFDIHLTDEEALYEKNLPLEKINHYDLVIFAYTHKSKKGDKSLSIHALGNWREARMGGNDAKVSRASALFQKHLFENLLTNTKKHDLIEKYAVTLEVTHHGPSLDKPCVFIEIGSTLEEWNDRRAGFVVAKTIADAIETFEPNQYHEVAIGLGGPHYCPNFTKLQETSNVAFAHIIPNYVAPITEDMIREAIEKTDEEVDFAVLDWKGLGTSEQRQLVINSLEKNYIAWKKSSDVSK